MKSKKILIISYAFPPMGIPMSPIVTKHMVLLARLGYEIDVLAAEDLALYYRKDHSLNYFVNTYASEVHRLKIFHKVKLFPSFTDPTGNLHSKALKYLKSLNLSEYDAILTFSPFSPVNRAMLDLKKRYPKIPWIAHFSDPWARNPLEERIFHKMWNAHFEPRAVKAADAIIHCSPYTFELMLEEKPHKTREKFAVIPHFFVEEFYPQRPKKKNNLITLRFIGTFFDNRNPQAFLSALNLVFKRRPNLQNKLTVEFIGTVPKEMRNFDAYSSIPKGTIQVKNSVDYLASLELMYDADILLLIEAYTKDNVFFPSKLVDYIGANSRILGITSSGMPKDICKMLKTWYACPSDSKGLSYQLEEIIDDVRINPLFKGYAPTIRDSFNLLKATNAYKEVFNKVTQPNEAV